MDSSGTTGASKGVRITAENLLTGVREPYWQHLDRQVGGQVRDRFGGRVGRRHPPPYDKRDVRDTDQARY